MRRSMSVLLWILVGAVAASVGIGYFYHQANRDREALAAEVDQAKQEALAAKSANEDLANEANRKLAEASLQIDQAQQQLKKYEAERILLSQAIVLTKPAPRLVWSWKEAVALPLGVSLTVPPVSKIIQADSALALATQTDASLEGEWLIVSAYDETREQTLTQTLEQTEPVAYSIDGRLLVGVHGKEMNTGGDTYLLHTQTAATSTHLIWARANAHVPGTTILNALATLRFRS